MSDEVGSIATLLDSALETIELTHHQLSFLPSAENFVLVNLAVRLWASVHNGSLREWGHHSSDDSWIEGIYILIDGFCIVTVHTPAGCYERRPCAEVQP